MYITHNYAIPQVLMKTILQIELILAQALDNLLAALLSNFYLLATFASSTNAKP